MKKILIINANYYKDISKNLIKCAKETLHNYQFKTSIINVPGIYEIPITLIKYIKKFDGFVVLGCVIKGETPHFNFISTSATDAIMKLSINHKKPIGNGIITCLNKEQAVKRSKTKGKEAAAAVYDILLKFKYD